MAILIGIILYIFAVTLIIAFGKFIKECDDSMLKGMKNEIKNRNRCYYPVNNLF
jgi:hypothetical protein